MNLYKHHSTKCESVVKITINRWSSYGVMIMNNTGICWFHKSVVNGENGGQLHRLYCI
jgi:hypothetical protein